MAGEDQYFLGHRAAEQVRLQQQADQLAADAAWLFDRVGSLSGRRVIEIGCGPRGSLDALSHRVGPTGTVVGVERSKEAVTLARSAMDERGLTNVEVIQGDGRATGLPRDSFDLATARLVLVNVPRPEEIVTEAVALVRPGGTVAFHEADWVGLVCDPPLDAWTRIIEILERYAASNGIDLFVGRRLPRLLRDGCLKDVRARPLIHEYGPGHGRRSILSDFVENLRERLIAQQFVTPEELDELQAAMKHHLEDPGTFVLSTVFVQAWGRKSG